MPKMTAASTDTAEEPSKGALRFGPDDDIPDPPVPSAVLGEGAGVDPATPAGQVVMGIDEALYKMSAHAAMVLEKMHSSWAMTVPALNHSQKALEALADAVRTHTTLVPFSASVNVTTPSGFPMKLSVQAASQEAFLGQVDALMALIHDTAMTPGAPF